MVCPGFQIRAMATLICVLVVVVHSILYIPPCAFLALKSHSIHSRVVQWLCTLWSYIVVVGTLWSYILLKKIFSVEPVICIVQAGSKS